MKDPVGRYSTLPAETIVAVPLAGWVIVGGPTVPFTCANTSTPVDARASVIKEMGWAMGRMRTVTVPLSQASKRSHAVTTNVSIPANVLPVGVYTKLPSAASWTVPCTGAVVTVKVSRPPSGSVSGSRPGDRQTGGRLDGEILHDGRFVRRRCRRERRP